MKFLDSKVFEIIPDITKITPEENITDELLIKLFALTTDDLIDYEKYKKTGEGRLSPEKIDEFKQFNIKCSGINNYNGCLNEEEYAEFIESTGAIRESDTASALVEAVPTTILEEPPIKYTVKKKLKKHLLLDQGGANITSTNTGTLKKTGKYKRLHKKSINKK